MSSQTRPRFSVVIPAYNEADYLHRTLASLDRQDFAGEFEVIVVDNNSDDGTSRIAEAHGARVVHEARPGVCFARQAGTEVSRGEIVVSTDADTTFPVTWLSTIDRAFAERPSCVAVAGPCTFPGAPWWGALYPKVLFTAVHLLALATGRVLYVTATNVSFRRDAWENYDTRLTQGGDELDLLRRLRRKGKVVFLPGNPTMTSARRLQRGLAYNFFVTFLYFYVAAYVINRLFRRTLLQTAPIFRTDLQPGVSPSRRWFTVALSGFCLMFGMLTVPLWRELAPGLEATIDVLQHLA